MESASNYSVEVVAVVCQLFSVFGTIESASTGYSLQCKLSSGHLLHVASTSLPISFSWTGHPRHTLCSKHRGPPVSLFLGTVTNVSPVEVKSPMSGWIAL